MSWRWLLCDSVMTIIELPFTVARSITVPLAMDERWGQCACAHISIAVLLTCSLPWEEGNFACAAECCLAPVRNPEYTDVYSLHVRMTFMRYLTMWPSSPRY
jgi:hypothetical protein